MGWAEKRAGSWRWRYRLGAQMVSQGGFPTKKAAEQWGRAVETDLARGVFLDPRGGDLTLTEWCAAWTAGRSGLKPRTVSTDRARIDNHIKPALGDLPLRHVTPLAVGTWVAGLERTLAPKTVRNCHGLLYAIMAGAVDAKLIVENPCRRTGLPELPEQEMCFLTHQQFDRLHAACPVHYRPLILTLAGTGFRWGEAVGLKAKYVDVLGGTLRVAETLHEDDGGHLTWGTPKTARSRRVVTINRPVQEALIPLVADRGRDDLVFTTPGGQPLRRGNFRRVWTAAVRDAGLETAPRPHDLRHSHVAWLIAAGVPLSAISRRLGHANITITDGTYGHLMREIDAGIMTALDDALGGSAPHLLPAPSGEQVDGDVPTL